MVTAMPMHILMTALKGIRTLIGMTTMRNLTVQRRFAIVTVASMTMRTGIATTTTSMTALWKTVIVTRAIMTVNTGIVTIFPTIQITKVMGMSVILMFMGGPMRILETCWKTAICEKTQKTTLLRRLKRWPPQKQKLTKL